MNKQASILFNFISSSNSGNCLALQAESAQHFYYQHLIYSLLSRNVRAAEDFLSLGRRLEAITRHAYFARQMDVVEQASQIMLALPISNELKGIAHYYQAICVKRKGDINNAHRLLELVVRESPRRFRARALLTIGATYFDSGEVEAALPFYLTAGRASRECDLFTQVESQRNIAAIRSIHGDHRQALEDIENLFPLARVIARRYPPLYYSFLNSLAVELGEVGRINEAQAICEITLASPFVSAYPEWSETRDELEAKRTAATPSIVAVSAAPELAPSTQPARNLKPARALVFVQPARERAFIQTSIAIALAVIARIEIIGSAINRVRHSINPRGPPIPLTEDFFLLLGSLLQPTKELLATGLIHLSKRGFCAQSQRLPAAISFILLQAWPRRLVCRSLRSPPV